MIEMRDVAFAYPRGGALFKGLTLSLPRGSFHFLTGPSGAGKTTFLRLCIADLLPSAGQMTLFGEDAATLGRDAIAGVRRRIGVVHQDTQFLDHLPVAENIALPMMVAGDQRRAAPDRLPGVGGVTPSAGWVSHPAERHPDGRRGPRRGGSAAGAVRQEE